MNDHTKPTIIDIINLIIAILFFGGYATLLFRQGDGGTGMLVALIAIGCVVWLGWCLHDGLRPATRYDWFRLWMIVRMPLAVVLFLAAVIGGLFLYPFLPQEIVTNDTLMILLCGVLMVLWSALILFLMWSVPRRFESDQAFKQRVRYQEKTDSTDE